MSRANAKFIKTLILKLDSKPIESTVIVKKTATRSEVEQLNLKQLNLISGVDELSCYLQVFQRFF